MEKQCVRCGETKQIDSFYHKKANKDGYNGTCKDCCIVAQREYRARYPVKLRLKRKEDYRKKLLYYKEYTSRPYVREAQNLRTQKHRTNNEYKAKIKARYLFNLAKKQGRIKSQPCRDCGNPKACGHHPDYNKPYEVIWLCHGCHGDEHFRIKQGA